MHILIKNNHMYFKFKLFLMLVVIFCYIYVWNICVLESSMPILMAVVLLYTFRLWEYNVILQYWILINIIFSINCVLKPFSSLCTKKLSKSGYFHDKSLYFVPHIWYTCILNTYTLFYFSVLFIIYFILYLCSFCVI
jgi:hypothetical protein